MVDARRNLVPSILTTTEFAIGGPVKTTTVDFTERRYIL
jgi:hypothetical protein